tara:strand:- start:325 stop:612 length:288 start_codon:yes stop_codon:yes gene_type:complete
MAIKKGDLVQVELPETTSMSNIEVQEELFTSLSLIKDGDFLIVVTAPYEHELPTMHQTSTRGRMFIVNSLMLCVDLLLGSKIYRSVPTKYLKRAE